ncbi:O-antigen ligase family protein [Patescibacteria group bacterium]|nr:O-antigen ligase family protein [Patescibacteria group bacterium]
MFKLAATTFFLTLFWQTRITLCCRYFHIDYAIPFVYLSDFLFAAWVVLTLSHKKKWRAFLGYLKLQRGQILPLALFLVWAALGLLNPEINEVAFWYRWVKILELLALVPFIAWQISHDNLKKSQIWKLISWGLLPLCLIAITEFIMKRSLNMQFLGEWDFSVKTPGIATFSWLGIDWLRPYSTFPHPNVLGGILSIVLPIMCRRRCEWNRKAWILLWAIMGLTLLLTLSRTAWVTFLLLMLLAMWPVIFANRGLSRGRDRFSTMRRIVRFSAVCILLGIFFFLLPNPITERIRSLGTVDSLSWLRRWDLSLFAIRLIRQSPFLGVGLNQFSFLVEKYGEISGPSAWAQPVHNLWLLIASETGFIGLGLFLWFVWKIISVRKRQKLASHRTMLGADVKRQRSAGKGQVLVRGDRLGEAGLILVGLFLTSLADHYWWTTQHGVLFLGICLGIILGTVFEKNQEIVPPPITSSSL